jgi:hypothetical protein
MIVIAGRFWFAKSALFNVDCDCKHVKNETFLRGVPVSTGCVNAKPFSRNK